jgi:hypothetical protein
LYAREVNKMKKYVIIGFWILIFGFTTLVVGCGQQETASTTTTTLPTGPAIALSGSLSTGTISSAGIRAFAAVSGYKVVAVNNDTGQSYHTSTDSSGNFTVNVPSGQSYEISLIDSNSNYFGPVVMVGDSSSSEVIMGAAPSDDTDLGSIVVDSSKSMAQPSTAPTSIVDSSDTATATNGVPKGAGNTGKTQLTGITTRSGSDMDQDGIPNLFDADEDNDGIRNGVASTPMASTVVSTTVESVMISSNIWADHGTTEDAKDIIAMRLHVIPVSGHESEIASVEVVDVPATIRNVATVRWADSLGDPTGYPSEHSLWSACNHQLFETTTLADTQWIISVCPKAIMSVGDIFTIRVWFTGGSYQDFFITTSYVLTDWSKIITYNGTTLTSNEGNKTTDEAAVFTTSTLEVVFSKPLDEDGNVLAGLTYSIIVGSVEAGGSGTLPVPTDVNSNEYQSYAYPSAFTDGASSVTVALHDLVTFATGAYYYITPVAESSDGQRNGEEVWFTKQ